jgi:hypothetical protein
MQELGDGTLWNDTFCRMANGVLRSAAVPYWTQDLDEESNMLVRNVGSDLSVEKA